MDSASGGGAGASDPNGTEGPAAGAAGGCRRGRRMRGLDVLLARRKEEEGYAKEAVLQAGRRKEEGAWHFC